MRKCFQEIADGKILREFEAPPEVALLGYLGRFDDGYVGDAAAFTHRL
jgi:hypothetical protein